MEEDNEEYLKEKDNASAVVNRAVEAWRESGGQERATLQIRLDRVEDTIADLEARLEKKRGLRDELQQQLERMDDREDRRESETWAEAMDVLRFQSFNSGGVVIESPDGVVERFADDLDMDAETFREEAIRRFEEDATDDA